METYTPTEIYEISCNLTGGLTTRYNNCTNTRCRQEDERWRVVFFFPFYTFYHVHGSPQTVEHRVTVLPFAKYITVSILVDINRGYPQTVEHRVTVLPFAKYIYTHSSSHVFGQ